MRFKSKEVLAIFEESVIMRAINFSFIYDSRKNNTHKII
jgi:hypothetical protein